MNIFPEDCWRDIFEYLPVSDLQLVSQTCKAMHALTELLIYREISWIWSTTTTTYPLRRLLCLARTLLERPDLAALVQHFSLLSIPETEWNLPESDFVWIPPDPDVDWDQVSSAFRNVTDRATQIIEQAGFPDADEWIEAIEDGDFYALTAILISQLPHLRFLQLDYTFVWMDGYPGRMVKHARLSPNDTLSKFDSLEIVDYGGNVPPPEMESFWDDENLPEPFPKFNDDSQYVGWFLCPSIRHLEIWLDDMLQLKERPEVDLSHLQNLVLSRSIISETDVLYLLTRTKSLKELHLGLTLEWDGGDSLYYYYSRLAEILDPVKDTVEHLSLGIHYFPFYLGGQHFADIMEESRWQDSMYGILRQFTRLKTAEVPIIGLLGVHSEHAYDLNDSILPDTLQKLVLRGDISNVGDYEWNEPCALACVDRYLAGDWRASTPHLRNITLHLWEPRCIVPLTDEEEQTKSQCEERVKSVCRREGLEFDTIVNYQLSPSLSLSSIYNK